MRGSSLNVAVGIVLVLAGLVWVLQGLDIAFAPQSFMTDDRRWVLWGGVTIAVGVFLLVRARRR